MTRVLRPWLGAVLFLLASACGDDVGDGSLDADAGDITGDAGSKVDSSLPQPDAGEEEPKDPEDPEDPEDGDWMAFTLQVHFEGDEPLTGVTATAHGFSELPSSEFDEENSELTVYVPEAGSYLIAFSADGAPTTYQMITVGEGAPSPSSVIFSPGSLNDELERLNASPLTAGRGVVMFVFYNALEGGGQTASLETGTAYAMSTLADDDSDPELILGDVLIDGAFPAIVYIDVVPGLIEPTFSSPNAGEECRPFGIPLPDGWYVLVDALTHIPVICTNEG